MAPVRLRGMTWSHRRAVDPLIETLPALRSLHPGIEVEWSSRPLSGFEFTPVVRLAESYDLIILDHPFMGAVAASRSLVPLDEVVGADDPFVGPSLAAYRMNGSIWALPVDAACQVGVARPDLLRRLDAEAPVNWAELMALGVKARRNGLWLAIGLQGVHSLMTFFTLMANIGSPCATERNDSFADPLAARHVLSLLRDLRGLCPPDVMDWNSIGLHDAMVTRDDLVCCPAVYCYATYAESDQRRPLQFHHLPGPAGSGGSTIGGTGLGVSALGRHVPAALAYARFAARVATQRAFALHHGQPAHRAVWEDEAINRLFGGCYRDTRATMDSCWIRPRYNGYLAFQEKAGKLMEAHLRGEIAEEALLSQLQRLHAGA